MRCSTVPSFHPIISPCKQQWSPSCPVAGLGTALQEAGQMLIVTEQEAILSDFPPLPFWQSSFLEEIRFMQSLDEGRSLTDMCMHTRGRLPVWPHWHLFSPSANFNHIWKKSRDSRHLGRWKFHENRLQHTEQCLPRGTGCISYWMPVKSQWKNRAAALLPTGKPPARGHSQPKMTRFLPLKCSQKSLHWIHHYSLNGALNRAFRAFFVLI